MLVLVPVLAGAVALAALRVPGWAAGLALLVAAAWALRGPGRPAPGVLRLAGPDAWLLPGSSGPVRVACRHAWVVGPWLAGVGVVGADGRYRSLYLAGRHCAPGDWRRLRVWLAYR